MDEKDKTIDRLQHELEELHGTFAEMTRNTAQSMKSLGDTAGIMLRCRFKDEVRISFPMGDGEFRMEVSLDALQDEDVRDALTKARGLLGNMLREAERD